MGVVGRIARELTVVLIALIITGILTAQADCKVNITSKQYGIYNIPTNGTAKVHFLSLNESLHRLREYLTYSVEVFKHEKGKRTIIKTEKGVYVSYSPSPREWFVGLYKTTPEHAILLTFVILSLTMALIFLTGLYWGVRAGYKGGWSDRVLSSLAPIFSGIPGWFWAILMMWLLWWNLNVSTINYMDYIKHAEGMKQLDLFTYLNALLLPIITLTVSNVVVYTFSVRNLIVKERSAEYFSIDPLKGLPDTRIMRKLLRTTLPSFLTFTSYNFLGLMSNAMAVEYLFNVPGIGYVFAKSVGMVYFSTESGAMHRYLFFSGNGIFFVTLVMGLFYFLNSAVMEVLYLKLDPRVRRDVQGQ